MLTWDGRNSSLLLPEVLQSSKGGQQCNRPNRTSGARRLAVLPKWSGQRHR